MQADEAVKQQQVHTIYGRVITHHKLSVVLVLEMHIAVFNTCANCKSLHVELSQEA